MAKKERFIITTPVATLGYGHLYNPDTKFNKDGDYKQDFFLSEEAAKKFCLSVSKDPRAKGAKLKYTKVDGTFKFKTKQHAKVKAKDGEVFDMKPKLYYIVDGKTVEYPATLPAPWSGSTGELELEVVPFDGFGGGLTMRLRAIRLHTIVEGTKSAGNWGDVEEGYTSESSSREGAEPEDDDELDEDAAEDSEEDEEVW